MWVVDLEDDKIYAYSHATGARDPAKDIGALGSAGNTSPRGIWSDGTTMWVSDSDAGKLFAYDLATKARDGSKDFDSLKAAGNEYPTGIWSDGSTMWVMDVQDIKIYAYDMATKARHAAQDFSTLSGGFTSQLNGIWSDGETMWVAADLGVNKTGADKIYAYDLETKARDAAKDFDGLSGAGNVEPTGIWSDGTTMWVANFERTAFNSAGERVRYFSSKIYAYNMSDYVPPPSDATLTGLAVSPVDISEFAGDVTEYHVGVANSITEASITPYASDAAATIDINGSAVTSGTSHAVSLTEGRNEVAITVTAGDRKAVKTYTVVIGRGVTTAFGWKAVDDFNALAIGNNHPSGIWSDGTTMWVANYNNAPLSKIFAYRPVHEGKRCQ